MTSKQLILTVVTSAAAGLGLYYLYRQSVWKKVRERKLKRILSVLETSDSCHVKDAAILRGKLRTLLDGGNAKFQILSDFDKTLTKSFYEGKKAHSSFQVIENSSCIGNDIAEELHALHAKYYPIEMSPTMPTEEKIPLMIEWYRSSFALGVKFGVSKSMISVMVKESYVRLREGIDEFFNQVKKYNVPMLVVSAGLGDVIDEVFVQQTQLPPQVSTLANYYAFDIDGVSYGLKGEEMLHTFNKNKTYALNKQYFDSNAKRSNALVMGDTLGDPNMTDDVKALECVFKVGFLNFNVDESLSQFLSVFDLVLTGDTSMDIITVLLHELFSE